MEINAEKRGNIMAEVISAKDLNNTQNDIIQKELHKKLVEKLYISYNTDKSIIGGLIIKYGSKMIDSSLVNKINKLELVMKGQ